MLFFFRDIVKNIQELENYSIHKSALYQSLSCMKCFGIIISKETTKKKHKYFIINSLWIILICFIKLDMLKINSAGSLAVAAINSLKILCPEMSYWCWTGSYFINMVTLRILCITVLNDNWHFQYCLYTPYLKTLQDEQFQLRIWSNESYFCAMTVCKCSLKCNCAQLRGLHCQTNKLQQES